MSMKAGAKEGGLADVQGGKDIIAGHSNIISSGWRKGGGARGERGHCRLLRGGGEGGNPVATPWSDNGP